MSRFRSPGYTLISVTDTSTGEASDAVTISPGSGVTERVKTQSNPEVFEDGVADISISANTTQQREVEVYVRFDYPSDSSRPVDYFDMKFVVRVNY